jgi:lambda repressor-like predicted transcriptional regulator
MDIYTEIERRKESAGSLFKLSAETGIHYSTLSNIVARRILPSDAVAKVFGYERVKTYTFRPIKSKVKTR